MKTTLCGWVWGIFRSSLPCVHQLLPETVSPQAHNRMKGEQFLLKVVIWVEFCPVLFGWNTKLWIIGAYHVGMHVMVPSIKKESLQEKNYWTGFLFSCLLADVWAHLPLRTVSASTCGRRATACHFLTVPCVTSSTVRWICAVSWEKYIIADIPMCHNSTVFT